MNGRDRNFRRQAAQVKRVLSPQLTFGHPLFKPRGIALDIMLLQAGTRIGFWPGRIGLTIRYDRAGPLRQRRLGPSRAYPTRSG